MTPGLRPLRLVSTFVLSAGLGGAALSEPPATPLDEPKLKQTLAGQKAAEAVATALADAETLAKLSTEKAVSRLKTAQAELALAGNVPTSVRTELDTKLDARVALLQGKPSPRPGTDPKAVEVQQNLRKLHEKAVADAKEIADGLKKAADAADAGRPDDARRLIAALTAKHPNSPELMMATAQGYTASQLRAEADLARRYSDAWLKSQRQLVASSLPATADMQFPDAQEWAKLTKLRRQQDKLKLTEKEEAILKSLDTPIAANFIDRPFEEALQDLSNQLNQPIYIDKKSLEEAGLDLSRRVTFKGNVSARTVLRAILQDNGLTFLVKDELIQVVTRERAEKDLSSRSYYLGDLVLGTGPFGDSTQWGPVASLQQAMTNAELVVKAVKDSVDPRCWKENGGACSITFHLPTMSVVVRASTEVHAMLSGAVTGSGKK